MKKIITLALILFISISTSFSQNSDIRKFKTTGLASKFLNENNNTWTDWSRWDDVSILGVFDLEKERITIYSKDVQVYDFAKYEGKTTNKDGDEILEWLCINEDGLKCHLEIWKRYYENGEYYSQIYVNYSDIRFVYNIYWL